MILECLLASPSLTLTFRKMFTLSVLPTEHHSKGNRRITSGRGVLVGGYLLGHCTGKKSVIEATIFGTEQRENCYKFCLTVIALRKKQERWIKSTMFDKNRHRQRRRLENLLEAKLLYTYVAVAALNAPLPFCQEAIGCVHFGDDLDFALFLNSFIARLHRWGHLLLCYRQRFID